MRCETGRLKTMMVVAAAVMLLACIGCQPQAKTSGPSQQVDQAQLEALVADGDVNDPTAIVLHELAGSFLLYQARTGKLPTDLQELVKLGLAKSSQLVDPVTGEAFAYSPDSKRQPRSPGRVMIYQSTDQGAAGRWALLVNDLASDGRIVTYVQRVPDAWLPAKKVNPNSVRIMR